MTTSWPYSIAAILMLMAMLAMAAAAALGVFASTANAQANGGNPPDVECAEAGGEFAGRFAETGEFTRPVNVGGTAVVISFKISGDTVTFFSEAPLNKFILVVKGGQLTEEFGPTRKGTFTLSNGQDIDHVTFCAPPPDAQGTTVFQGPIAAGGGGGGGTILFDGTHGPPVADGGGPAILLPAAALLLGSGILTYTVLRRRG